MNTPEILAAESIAHAELEALQISIVYDTLVCGVRAKGFCDQLCAQSEAHTDLRESLWRSDLLELPDIQKEAAEAALNSDVVVLSLRGDMGISDAFDRWLGSWMRRATGRNITLVALFDPATALRMPMDNIRCYLRKAAFASGLHFFACAVSSDGNGASSSPAESLELDESTSADAKPEIRPGLQNHSPRASAPTILVVDDNESIRTFVGNWLRSEGHRVVTAHDGEAARDMLAVAGSSIDLVVTDIDMPRLRGDALAAWLRCEHPAIRVLLMSSLVPRAGGTQALPFIAKPFRREDLIRAVRPLLDPAYE